MFMRINSEHRKNVVTRGARGPVDFGFAQTEAERRSNPRCFILYAKEYKRKIWKRI